VLADCTCCAAWPSGGWNRQSAKWCSTPAKVPAIRRWNSLGPSLRRQLVTFNLPGNWQHGIMSEDQEADSPSKCAALIARRGVPPQAAWRLPAASLASWLERSWGVGIRPVGYPTPGRRFALTCGASMGRISSECQSIPYSLLGRCARPVDGSLKPGAQGGTNAPYSGTSFARPFGSTPAGPSHRILRVVAIDSATSGPILEGLAAMGFSDACWPLTAASSRCWPWP